MNASLHCCNVVCVCVCVRCQPMTANYLAASPAQYGSAQYAAVPVIPASLAAAAAVCSSLPASASVHWLSSQFTINLHSAVTADISECFGIVSNWCLLPLEFVADPEKVCRVGVIALNSLSVSTLVWWQRDIQSVKTSVLAVKTEAQREIIWERHAVFIPWWDNLCQTKTEYVCHVCDAADV